MAITLSFITIGNDFIFSSLWTKKPINKEYATAIAPASVGVNTPNRIPPTIIIGISKPKISYTTKINQND